MELETPSRGKIIVFGILFWYPLAGVTFQFLHYLVGLRRLGYDVYYVEDPDYWPYDPQTQTVTPDASENVSRVAPVLEAHGFAGKWAYRGAYEGGACYGMTEEALLRLYRDANAMLNVTGAQMMREEHLACPRRVYVETDPGASQILAAQGDPKRLRLLQGHDTFFSYGENLGAPDCILPLGGRTWRKTRQPVILDWWENPDPTPGPAYTTITSWHNKHLEVTYEGETYYWTKDREFERFLDLPCRRDVPFELATDVDAETERRLRGHGWRVAPSLVVSTDADRYRDYIQRSRGEFTVARDQVVRPNTGWFSDRSACYLAAGRPVITQETGFHKFLPTGCGLFGFSTMEGILAAVDAVESDYEVNSRGAREIACEYFDAGRVLSSMMERAGLL